jgi:predicted TIM-barrel fold metal-dependent hydrolase
VSVIVDSHVHVVADDRDAYPLRPQGFGRVWWEDVSCSVDALLANMDGAGVDRAVVVQAVGPYGFDNAYLLDAVAAHPDRLRAVAAVDLDDDPVAVPDGVVGIRCFAVGDRAAWVARRDVFDAVLERAPTVVLTAFHPQLDALLPALRAHPGTPVAVDHAGFPDPAAGPRYPVLERLAELPHASVKVTGHAGDPAYLFDLFGPERVLAGSDWPQSDGTYEELWADLRAHASAGFLGDNAARLWFA